MLRGHLGGVSHRGALRGLDGVRTRNLLGKEPGELTNSSTRPRLFRRGLHETKIRNHLLYVNTNENFDALTDDNLTDEEWVDVLREFIRPAMEAIEAEIERWLPPEEIERRLGQIKAAVAEQARPGLEPAPPRLEGVCSVR